MLYIAADIHGDRRKLESLLFDVACDVQLQSAGEMPTLLICGDFGFPFLHPFVENRILTEINSLGVEIAFLDGNHENHSFLNSLPVSDWHGGKVHQLCSHIYHLMRGQIYQIDGRSVFTMGGAASLDKAWRLGRERELGRKLWWPEEIPSGEELRQARDNLAAAGYRADIILSHTSPISLQRLMGYIPTVSDIQLSSFLEWVAQSVEFERWCFGHFHEDRDLGRYSSLFDRVIKL